VIAISYCQLLSAIIGGNRIGRLVPGSAHRGNNSAKFQHAEEFLAARIAPVGWETQDSLQIDKDSTFDTVARDIIKIEISAPRTVCIKHERQGHQPSAKPFIAGVTSPGLDSRDPTAKIIHSPFAARSKTVRTSAARTDHSDFHL